MNRNRMRNNDRPFAQRIQHATFALTMVAVIIFGGSSSMLLMADVPDREHAAHQGAVRLVGEALSNDIGNRLGNLERLSGSALVWTALTDSTGRESYLKPFLSTPNASYMELALLDYRGRPLVGKLPADAADGRAGRMVAAVLESKQARSLVLPGRPAMLLVARPVLYPYTHEAIGVLVASIDVSGLFRRRSAGLAADLGVDLIFAGGTIERHAVAVPDRYYPVRYEIRPAESVEGDPLALDLYGTRNPWLQPLLRDLFFAALSAGLFDAAIWYVAGIVSRRTTQRLNRLVEFCAATARSESVSIPEDDYADEIGVLTRTLRQAVAAYREINDHLAGLVDMRTKALSESEERLELSIQGAGLAVADWDIAGDWIEYGAGWEKLLGRVGPELPNNSNAFIGFIWAEDAQPLRAALLAHLKGQTASVETETRLRHKNGQWVWVHARCMVVKRDASGRALRMAGIAMNITEKKRAEIELDRISRLNEALLNSAGEGIYGVDLDGKCSFVNPAALAMLGFEQDEIIGKEPHPLFHAHRHDDSPYLVECPVLMTLRDGIRRDVEDAFLRKTGEAFPVQMTVTPIRDADRIIGADVVFQDISRRKAMEAELLRLATTDALTGIANRRRFLEQVEAELARTRRFGEPAALLMLDIDHFKKVNDTCGHATGDAVLKHFVYVSSQHLRETDAMGRLGGEEFAVLLPGTDRKGAWQFAERLRRHLADTPAQSDAGSIAITVSIGVAACDRLDETPDSVLSRADVALYRAKKAGRNRVEGNYPAETDTALQG